jgi:hypothetical protein
MLGFPWILGYDVYYIAFFLFMYGFYHLASHIQSATKYKVELTINAHVDLKEKKGVKVFSTYQDWSLSIISNVYEFVPLSIRYFREVSEFRPLRYLRAPSKSIYYLTPPLIIIIAPIIIVLDFVYFTIAWLFIHVWIYPYLDNRQVHQEKWNAMILAVSYRSVSINGVNISENETYMYLLIRSIALCLGWYWPGRPVDTTKSAIIDFLYDYTSGYPNNDPPLTPTRVTVGTDPRVPNTSGLGSSMLYNTKQSKSKALDLMNDFRKRFLKKEEIKNDAEEVNDKDYVELEDLTLEDRSKRDRIGLVDYHLQMGEKANYYTLENGEILPEIVYITEIVDNIEYINRFETAYKKYSEVKYEVQNVKYNIQGLGKKEKKAYREILNLCFIEPREHLVDEDQLSILIERMDNYLCPFHVEISPDGLFEENKAAMIYEALNLILEARRKMS